MKYRNQLSSETQVEGLLYEIWMQLSKLNVTFTNGNLTLGNIMFSDSCILIKPSTQDSLFTDDQTMKLCNNNQGGFDVSVLINGIWSYKQTL